MGKKDITLNDCLSEAERYADCFNAALQATLISPERLTDMDRIVEGSIHLSRTVAFYKKERDGIRGITNKSGIICAIVCIENQSEIHYAQVARHLIYDALNYNKQLLDIRKKNEEQIGTNGFQDFLPDDHLIPTITVCVYYGQKAWDAPMQLTELMDFSEFTKKEAQLWKQYIQDYRIVVLDIRRMKDEQLEAMTSDLKLLFGMLKHSEDKESLHSYVHQHEKELENIKSDLADAFAVLSGTRGLEKHIRQNQQEGGMIHMCKAIDDMLKDSRAEGRTEGRYNTLIELLKDNLISINEAAKRLNMTEEALLQKMNS